MGLTVSVILGIAVCLYFGACRRCGTWLQGDDNRVVKAREATVAHPAVKAPVVLTGSAPGTLEGDTIADVEQVEMTDMTQR